MNKVQSIFLALVLPLSGTAQTIVEWHNEATDTILATDILTDVASKNFKNPSERTGYIARMFIGKPYVAHTLEGDTENLRINFDELDCTTFVDIAMALSFTVGEHRQGWQDFVYNLERMRYRNGVINGYASRLHYNCEWAINNTHRGNIADVTTLSPKYDYQTRSIDFMTSHRDSYPALADSATYAAISAIENGYRNHRFPYIKTIDLTNKGVLDFLRDGDVIAFVSNRKDLDVTHMGIVVKEDGKTKVLHASSTDGVVEISRQPIHDFVKRNRGWIGIRVYRLKE